MAWRIEFEDTALKELAKLDKQVARRILAFLRERVAVLDDPRSVGEALKGSRLGEFWKYRVGDYRIITNVIGAGLGPVSRRVFCSRMQNTRRRSAVASRSRVSRLGHHFLNRNGYELRAARHA